MTCDHCGGEPDDEAENVFLLCDCDAAIPEHGCHAKCHGLTASTVPEGEWKCDKKPHCRYEAYELEEIYEQKVQRNADGSVRRCKGCSCNGALEYACKWSGYPVSAISWEPRQHLVDPVSQAPLKALSDWETTAHDARRKPMGPIWFHGDQVQQIFDQKKQKARGRFLRCTDCECNGILMYECKWRGFDRSKNSWVPKEHLVHPEGTYCEALKAWEKEATDQMAGTIFASS